jgi:hypothetical protein
MLPGGGYCGLLPPPRQLPIDVDAIGSGSAALGCANMGAGFLATLATALRQQITGDRAADGPPLDKRVTHLVVFVSATGGVPDRLRPVAAQVRAHKEAATGSPPISC